MGSEDEITLKYKIGTDRDYKVSMLNENCESAVDEDVVTFTNNTNVIEDDPSNSDLLVSVNITKSLIATSNIWVNEADSSPDKKVVRLCAKVQLFSGVNEIKKLERVIEVNLNFENNFQTIQNATFDKISLDTNETEAAVNDYIKACTCDGNKNPFVCNTNTLGVDDFLNICLESLDAEMQINYLDSLEMTQGEGEGANTLNIVSNQGLVDGSISSKSSRASGSGVHIASIIPASFFSYDSSTTAKVSGVVFLKLSGSRRRLAAEMDDSSTATHARALQSTGDQESAFSMEVQLEKNELDVTADFNGAIYEVMSGAVSGVTAVVTAATFLMWMW